MMALIPLFWIHHPFLHPSTPHKHLSNNLGDKGPSRFVAGVLFGVPDGGLKPRPSLCLMREWKTLAEKTSEEGRGGGGGRGRRDMMQNAML